MDDILLINPNTRTCPIFRSQRDAEITKAIYQRVPVLIKEGTPEENPWAVEFHTMFHMSNDSHLFRTREQMVSQGFALTGNIFTRRGEKYLPLYEAKMMYQLTHRYGDYAMRAETSQDTELPRIPSEKLKEPNYAVMPRYWIKEWEVIKATANVPRMLVQAVTMRSEQLASQIISAWFAEYALACRGEEATNALLIQNVLDVWNSMEPSMQRRFAAMALHEEYPLGEVDFFWNMPNISYLEVAERLVQQRTPTWLIGFRDITNATNERTALLTVLPLSGMGNKIPFLVLRNTQNESLPEAFVANWSSFVFDYATRQKLAGTTMNFFYVKQLPLLAPSQYSKAQLEYVKDSVLELLYTSTDLAPFARSSGYSGPPFRWDDHRRFLLRCELDALYFHLYGITRDSVDYIMDTFPILRRKDEQRYEEYITKRLILEIYDAMAEAHSKGVPFKTRLNPPPADPRVAHLTSTLPLPLPVSLISQHTPILDGLKQIPDDTWMTPSSVTAENLALFALIDVLRSFNRPVHSQQVRTAALLVRKPALALAFLRTPEAKEWIRVVGNDARPLPTNVIDISRFQHDAADSAWAEAFNHLTGAGGLVTNLGTWSVGPRLPESSGEEWVSGRAALAVRIAAELGTDQANERLDRFLRSVKDGTA